MMHNILIYKTTALGQWTSAAHKIAIVAKSLGCDRLVLRPTAIKLAAGLRTRRSQYLWDNLRISADHKITIPILDAGSSPA
jgi:hypothetical protein